MHIEKTSQGPSFCSSRGQERCYLQSQINGLHWPVLALRVTQFAVFSESLQQKRNITTCKYLSCRKNFTANKACEKFMAFAQLLQRRSTCTEIMAKEGNGDSLFVSNS